MTALLAATAGAAVVLSIGWHLRPLPAIRANASVGPMADHRGILGRARDVRPPGRRAKAVTATVAAVVAWLVLGPLPAALLGGGVVVASREQRRRKLRRAVAARSAALPAAVDLLVVALAAGVTIRQALRLVAERGPPALRPPFADVVGRIDVGEAMSVALPRLLIDIGEPVRGLVRAIVVADRDGVPVRALLMRMAEHARRERRHALEAAIRRLPVRLAFPLVGCVLPAFVVLTIVPVVGAGLQRLGPVGL